MRPEQWTTFKRAARLEPLDRVPMALIVTVPGFPATSASSTWITSSTRRCGSSRTCESWRSFPDIIFVPSWWMEYGMAAEPSALGAKIKFWQDNTPSEYHTLLPLEDIEKFPDTKSRTTRSWR